MAKVRIVLPKQNNTLVRAGIPPIGTIIWCSESTSPAEYWGGVWERFAKGQVVVGVDEDDSDFIGATVSVGTNKEYIDKTGGEKTHTLTINEMPTHSHTISMRWQGATIGNYYVMPPLTSESGITYESTFANNPIHYTGGSQAHNNLQPYVTAYCWRRIG